MALRPYPHKKVTFRAKGFWLGRRRLQGITKLLQQRFYPHYRAEQAHFGPDPPRSRPVRDAPDAPSGRERGSLVDRELAEFTALSWKHGLDWDQLLHPHHHLRSLSAPELARLRHLQHNCHRFTRAILQCLQANRLRLVAAQVPVGSATLRLATAVDLVVAPAHHLVRYAGGYRLAPHARLTLLEIKTGFPAYLRHTGNQLAPPLQHLDDSPYHQHQLQLWLTRTFFQRTFPHDVAQAAVLQVTLNSARSPYRLQVFADGQVRFHPQRAWTPTEARHFWNALARTPQ